MINFFGEVAQKQVSVKETNPDATVGNRVISEVDAEQNYPYLC